MKPPLLVLILSLSVLSSLVPSSFAAVVAGGEAEDQDSLAVAIQQGSEAAPNPAPAIDEVQKAAIAETEKQVAEQKAQEAKNTASQPLIPTVSIPATPGGSNAIFNAAKPEEPTGAVLDSLTPNLSGDLLIDPLVKERARIRLIGDFQRDFRNAPVISVVRALAEHAQMRYVTTASESLNAPVTISGAYNTLDLLDILQDNYNVSMTFERGTWRIGKSRPDSLVYRSYRIRDNSREQVDITSPSIESSIGMSGSNGSGSTSSGNGSNSGSGGAFKVSYDPLTKDILDLITTPLPASDDAASATAPVGKVTFIAETSELMVLASPYHHDLVKQYLARVDKPIDKIEFSAYFVESTRAPEQNLGIDWSNAVKSVASGSSAPGDTKFVIPKATILNTFEFAAALKFTESDSDSWISQSPTVVGMPNRKTVLDATQQIPVAQSTTDNNSTAASTTTSSLQYIDVGTIVNIFPVVLKSDEGLSRIRLHVSLVVSSITGEKIISGNPAPVTSRRRFEFSIEVPDGQTLVIGGLVSSSTTHSSNKVPFLSAIPGIGRAFRADNDKATRTNMTVYITPRIIETNSPAKPPALPRVWPQDLSFERPLFGSDEPSISAVRRSLEGFPREIRTLEVYNEQARDPDIISSRLKDLQNELDAMSKYIKGLRKEGVVVDVSLIKEISALSSRAASLRMKIITQLGI